MHVKEAQAQLRYAYFNGGVGTVISGLVWLAAAFVTLYASIATGFTVLFFGGMFIFPLTVLAIKLTTARTAPPSENPGAGIVIETIFPMMAGLFAAWLFLPYKPEWTMPMAAIAVGSHYFGFKSAYGEPLYWVLGSIMCLAGFMSIFANLPGPIILTFAIAAIEILFGIILFVRCEPTSPPTAE